ncbi:MAG: aspartate carbamoyltransferase [Planctomycetota bacterium]|jgi:aspartate carbamoyltransferase catalytic subunit|nr:aspartate carbamoyltransferase [Planctomycetota bacterium]
MPLSTDLKPLNIKDVLEATGMRGKSMIFLDDWSREQLGTLFEAAKLLEPYSRARLDLLKGKVLYTLFFQPSTRTRCSHEAAMLRMGGGVITETDPLHNSAMAKNESLYDSIRVISQYADVLVLRHGDSDAVFAAIDRLGPHACPIISGAFGHVTHPTQGLLDMYTAYRVVDKPFTDMRIIISTPDLSRARSGQSFALGAARMGAHIIYTGASELRTPQVMIDKLKAMGASYEEHFDLDKKGNIALMEKADLLYLPGSSLKKEDPNREDFMRKVANHHFTLDDLQGIKRKTGRAVGIMHSLPRNDFEFDQAIDNSEFELYFKQIGYSVPLRMALLGAICGVN